MEFMEVIKNFWGVLQSFGRANPMIALAVLVILVIFLYRKPFFFLSLLLLCFILTGLYFVIIDTSRSADHS